MFQVQIETAQRTAFALVLDEVIFSRRRYIGSFNDQLISNFVGLDWKGEKTHTHTQVSTTSTLTQNATGALTFLQTRCRGSVQTAIGRQQSRGRSARGGQHGARQR